MRRLPLLALAAGLLPAALPAQRIAQSEYAARRDAVLAKIPEGVLVAFGAGEPAQDYISFWQSSPFMYLTGFDEPDAALVVVKRGGATRVTMFVNPRDPGREVWTGARLGVEGTTSLTGIPARDNAALDATLDSLAALNVPFYVVGDLGDERDPIRTADAQRVARLTAAHPGLRVQNAAMLVAAARGKKSDTELALIRKAVSITVDAQREAMRAIAPGMNEFEIQSLIEYTFRRQGADRPSFSTIVGSGPNSTTLHYNRDDRFIADGEVIVMDIGASAGGYAADVTRTVPANGTYSPAQREIYRVVRDAQAAAERQAKLGAQAKLMTDSSSAVLAAGLAKLGLIESAAATYDCGTAATPRSCPQFRLYYMHGIGHGIGLDVHDPDQYYFGGVIAPGSAFTIEPGIYVRANTADILPDTPKNRALAAKIRPAVAKYANIGVRIEDDYVATPSGVEWISRAPREMDEIEALMKEPYTGPAARDSALVQWRRQ
ncbi:MAG: M24 family metallopeptidase [Gemmatimonadaceae bacterium]|nr:M24 family metallopeptidase [Gemmatimonadaceae bacterium]NUQ93692.1 M24 family metallopeptidase [Gemmatimonadaceae bacterium]NUR18314.1 M24 family metallopeptidase [Gemmatimonadaceae bacterium]NUS98146.1 M24 family metallopeptidase [Gemmatimonadaceae bacterium]